MTTRSKLTTLTLCSLAAGFLPAQAAVLIDHTFDGVANDTGPAFQEVQNTSGTAGTANLSTGEIKLGNFDSSNVGFNNVSTVNVTALDPTATGFTATFYVTSTTADVSSLLYNGMFFGVVSGTAATGTGGSNLWVNNPDAFGYVAGSGAYGDHLMRQDGTTDANSTNSSLTTTQPTDASFKDGFTLSLSMFNDNSWSITSTGLSTNLNGSGSLNTAAFSYADIVNDLGLYVSLQGQAGNPTITMNRMTLESVAVPEPSSALLCLGGLGLLLRRRR